MEYGSGSEQNKTVTVRVQVIDMQSFTLDLTVPTYLPAHDLSQRIARDAGLEAHWANGQRRLYWLRGRGRILDKDDTFAEIGISDGELVYLLPEPPPGSGVEEQSPDFPETRGYTAKGAPALTMTLMMVFVWSIAWALLVSASQHPIATTLPSIGVALLCTNIARHGWGGAANRLRVLGTGLVLYTIFFFMMLLACFVLLLNGGAADSLVGLGTPEMLGEVTLTSLPGFLLGFIGVCIGWVAWWGSVEPIQERSSTQQYGEEVEGGKNPALNISCSVCHKPIAAEVRIDCPKGCGCHFHSGCYDWGRSLQGGGKYFCPVCNAK